MNYLKAVFWDYPEFADKNVLEARLRTESKSDLYFWIMMRFLEHGRVVDTLHYFKIEEIAQSLSKLRLTSYASRKWKRLIEVYGRS
jgi:hypothetical protein